MQQDDPRDKTLRDLQWPQIVEAVAARLSGEPEGRFDLPLAQTPEGMRCSIEETAEALRQLREGEPLPLTGLRPIAQHLLRVERQGSLDAPALNEIRSELGAARVLRRFLAKRRESLPRLSAACGFDPSLDSLQGQLDAAFDNDGTLADHASPQLRKLRTETHNLRARLIGRLESLIHEKAELLSDGYYTEREGRYVLPVRADAHERVHGIVHGTSARGNTIFVEPRALIAAGNRFKLAQAEQAREEARILADLSELVRERVAVLRAAHEALQHADLRAASAALCRELNAVVPDLDTDMLDLREARHPLLVLDGTEVVANDVRLAPGEALVISGPNAGGKTVALKLLGLAALMTRAGLLLPVAEGSRCGFFDPVLSDVGDDQSLSRNLSTFSAHVTRLSRILELADRRSLVLLDELAGSTDPEEGAALACALVEELCRAGAAVAVTTHYEALKARGALGEHMENASVGFDVARLAPTFKLRTGVPGASSALAVAARFGIPSRVLARAKEVLPEQTRAFETLIRGLEERARELDAAREDATQARAAAERDRAEAERLLAVQRERDAKTLSTQASQLLEELRSARIELEDARRTLRRKKLDDATLQKAKAQVEAAAHTARDKAEPNILGAREDATLERLSVDGSGLAAGAHVYVPRLRAEAEIVEGPNSKGQVRVAAGALKLWVQVAELKQAVRVAPTPSRATTHTATPVREAETERPVHQTLDNTLDVRGLRVEDAVAMLESFLDQLFGRSERAAFVVHGIGSGALRDGIRRWLRQPSPYVRDARPGEPEEGSDRVTVVLLR